mmetsp:Transcript_20565/g.64550  ORF Transcript_20565/g.64550 Transcript_20565/m.64550 type:complete len:335 (+) Transcript_20565:116-1120(+)
MRASHARRLHKLAWAATRRAAATARSASSPGHARTAASTARASGGSATKAGPPGTKGSPRPSHSCRQRAMTRPAPPTETQASRGASSSNIVSSARQIRRKWKTTHTSGAGWMPTNCRYSSARSSLEGRWLVDLRLSSEGARAAARETSTAAAAAEQSGLGEETFRAHLSATGLASRAPGAATSTGASAGADEEAPPAARTLALPKLGSERISRFARFRFRLASSALVASAGCGGPGLVDWLGFVFIGLSPSSAGVSRALASCALASRDSWRRRRRRYRVCSTARAKMAGSSSAPSALITPSAPVSWRVSTNSAASRTLPLVSTGIVRASLMRAT